MMESLEDNQSALPYGGLVTKICKMFVKDIPSHELEHKPEGAFGKKTVMKSDTQLQRHMDVDEPAPPPPPVQPEPSAASSSQAAPFSDAVTNALDRITRSAH